ncbi:MAG: glycosyltransferase family 2 protein [Clostridia bacterium]|nr:glycosyltransferase family 2 protein [Clostridia bacterium]
MKPVLYFVIPCYNEQEVLPVTAPMFRTALEGMISDGMISPDSKIMFVNDGSRDKTWSIIEQLSSEHACFEGISLSRNRGHQNALLGGLMYAKERADVTISIDCDGQDDINASREMVAKYLEGFDVVYGVRDSRESDTFFKRTTARGFYKLMKGMGAQTVYDHADYRLMSRRALEALSEFKEVNIFLRGMVPLVGFKSTSVYYNRTPRLAGKSHYPLKKMLSLAIDGITSLSTKPIRLVTGLGFFVTLVSFAGIIWSIVQYFLDQSVAGWSSTVAIVCFLGGIQLLSLGIIGEYVGKIYLETKNRPRYIISEETEKKD